jgi:uncharacterized membrane protein
MKLPSFTESLPYVLAISFLVSGTAHFLTTESFVKIVPPALPAPRTLVYVSGVFELLGAIGLLIPATRTAAAYGLIALLVAVFPANIYMAFAAEKFKAFAPAWALWARLPLQFVLIWWAWLASKR